MGIHPAELRCIGKRKIPKKINDHIFNGYLFSKDINCNQNKPIKNIMQTKNNIKEYLGTSEIETKNYNINNCHIGSPIEIGGIQNHIKSVSSHLMSSQVKLVQVSYLHGEDNESNVNISEFEYSQQGIIKCKRSNSELDSCLEFDLQFKEDIKKFGKSIAQKLAQYDTCKLIHEKPSLKNANIIKLNDEYFGVISERKRDVKRKLLEEKLGLDKHKTFNLSKNKSKRSSLCINRKKEPDLNLQSDINESLANQLPTENRIHQCLFIFYYSI